METQPFWEKSFQRWVGHSRWIPSAKLRSEMHFLRKKVSTDGVLPRKNLRVYKYPLSRPH